MNLTDLGENPSFIAFNAHCWFAFSVVYVSLDQGLDLPRVVWTALVVAAVKEFIFDATQEKNPPQTFLDNLEDFCGYAVGTALAAVLA